MQKTPVDKTLTEPPAAVASSPVPSATPPRAGDTPLRSDIPTAPADEAGGGSLPASLTSGHYELLLFLSARTGADIYNYADAVAGRALEAAGLVRIVKAKSPPPATDRQPYYGIKINAAGRAAIARAGAA